jgi:hypothetical protein
LRVMNENTGLLSGQRSMATGSTVWPFKNDKLSPGQMREQCRIACGSVACDTGIAKSANPHESTM